MHAFLSTIRPRSVQARHSERYKVGLLESCKRYWPEPPMLEGPLYGAVYYFHRRSNELDADNLSKPVWDALIGHMYQDDRSIQLRKAGVRDLREGSEVVDLTNIPENVATDFLTYLGDVDYLIYVEIGRLDPSMFTFAPAIRYAV